MQVRLRSRPVPQGEHDVALGALRPRRLAGRQLAGGDAIRPVTEELQRARVAHPAEVGGHLRQRLPRLDAALPGVRRRREVAKLFRDGAHRLGADRVAAVTAVGLHNVEPLLLALQRLVDAVAVRPRAGEFAPLRHPEHRVPVDRRVVLRRGRGAGRGHRGQVEDLARHRLHLRRVHEPVTAHPDVVVGLRQLGKQVAATVVGDHDLRELRRQVRRLRDHPHSGLRPAGAGDHAAEVGRPDPDRRVGGLLSVQPRLPGGEQQCRRHDGHGDHTRRFHAPAPLASDRSITWTPAGHMVAPMGSRREAPAGRRDGGHAPRCCAIAAAGC